MTTVTMVLAAWLLTGIPGGDSPPAPGASGTFVSKVLRLNGVTYEYSVYLPPGYRKGQPWPVILALHDANERGLDGEHPRARSLAEAVRIHPERYPALLVLPQCPPQHDWSGDVADFALQALETTLGEYGGDPKRVYLTGQSMGAWGAVQFAARYPDRFAAIVAVSGRYPDPDLVRRLKGLPVSMWHGEKDKEVPVDESRAMLKLLKNAGNRSVQYTELSGLGHDIADTVYLDAAVSTWLFAQHRE